MGYTVLVRYGRIRSREVVFSSNISHRAMAEALSAACDLLAEEARSGALDDLEAPTYTVGAIATGLNGLELDRRAVEHDYCALSYAATLLDCLDHPMTWVLKVLERAFDFAQSHGGRVVFD